MSTIAISTAHHERPRMSSSVRPRLRLTRRGHAVIASLAAMPLVIGAMVFALNGGAATATHETSTVPFTYVTVESGQSLWGVAENLAPTSDPREVIDAIIRLNGLASADVYAGQELAIPSQYTASVSR